MTAEEKLVAENAQLRRLLDEALEDAARMDWLEGLCRNRFQEDAYIVVPDGPTANRCLSARGTSTLRDAIDEARRKEA